RDPSAPRPSVFQDRAPRPPACGRGFLRRIIPGADQASTPPPFRLRRDAPSRKGRGKMCAQVFFPPPCGGGHLPMAKPTANGWGVKQAPSSAKPRLVGALLALQPGLAAGLGKRADAAD